MLLDVSDLPLYRLLGGLDSGLRLSAAILIIVIIQCLQHWLVPSGARLLERKLVDIAFSVGLPCRPILHVGPVAGVNLPVDEITPVADEVKGRSIGRMLSPVILEEANAPGVREAQQALSELTPARIIRRL
jgi:hypothetical protein